MTRPIVLIGGFIPKKVAKIGTMSQSKRSQSQREC